MNPLLVLLARPLLTRPLLTRPLLARALLPRALAFAVLLASSATNVSAQPKEPPRGQLSVNITQLRNNNGRVAVALFNTAAAFPDQKRALRGKVSAIVNKGAQVTFPDLAPGIYAVAVLHDENSNNEMDFNFVGMPLEGYGFSNDAPVLFGPPSFDAAAFRLREGAGRIAVSARYFSL